LGVAGGARDILSYGWLLYFIFLVSVFVKAAWASLPVFKDQFKGLMRRDALMVALLAAAGLALMVRHTFHIDLDPYGWGFVEDALAIKDIFFLRFPARFVLSAALHVPGYSFFLSIPLMIAESLTVVSSFNLAVSVLAIGLVYLVSYALTADRIASVMAAGLLAVSTQHIVYSGYEFPMPVSVFFVGLEFLFLICFMKTKKKPLGLGLLFLFFITINIKLENVVFLPVFLFVFFGEAKNDREWRETLRGYLMPAILLSVATLAFCFGFLLNWWGIQTACISAVYHGRNTPFGAVYFIKNFGLFLSRSGGMPLWAAAGLLLIQSFQKTGRAMNLAMGWLLAGLVPLCYYARANAEWQILQILIPVFLVMGYVVAKALELFVRRGWIRLVLVFSLLFLLGAKADSDLGPLKAFSWKDIKKDFPACLSQDCIVTLRTNTSGMALEFLFPQRHWLFINDAGLDDALGRCRGNIYYFNPVVYGLLEETERQTLVNAEAELLRRFQVGKRVGPLELFELKPRRM
jgi:hypothetical protein